MINMIDSIPNTFKQDTYTHITACIQSVMLYVYRYITISYKITHYITFNITEIMRT